MNQQIQKIKIKTNQIIFKIKSLPKEQLTAYGAMVLGLIFILLAIILW